MFYILDLSFLLLSAIEFLRNSAIQVKFIIIIIIIIAHSTGSTKKPDCQLSLYKRNKDFLESFNYKIVMRKL